MIVEFDSWFVMFRFSCRFSAFAFSQILTLEDASALERFVSGLGMYMNRYCIFFFKCLLLLLGCGPNTNTTCPPPLNNFQASMRQTIPCPINGPPQSPILCESVSGMAGDVRLKQM